MIAINEKRDPVDGMTTTEALEYDLHTRGARHSFESPFDGRDPERNKGAGRRADAKEAEIDRLRNALAELIKACDESWEFIDGSLSILPQQIPQFTAAMGKARAAFTLQEQEK